MNDGTTTKNSASERQTAHGETVSIDIWYPRCDGAAKFIEVGLMDVRAADNIRVSYDFERDGWKIEQASIFQWPSDDPVCDEGWKEVSFVQAWASKPGGL